MLFDAFIRVQLDKETMEDAQEAAHMIVEGINDGECSGIGVDAVLYSSSVRGEFEPFKYAALVAVAEIEYQEEPEPHVDHCLCDNCVEVVKGEVRRKNGIPI